MTFKEKEELQKLIQKLPPENIRRVAEIVIQHRTDKTDLSGEIHIGLDKENNTTLWRLYYYVEAVEKAKKLASK
uniref:NET domain-containing protein n=2 Tax=Cucumis sativus TaxID=3659 RepID=A0A0A0LB98_CUCSA